MSKSAPWNPPTLPENLKRHCTQLCEKIDAIQQNWFIEGHYQKQSWGIGSHLILGNALIETPFEGEQTIDRTQALLASFTQSISPRPSFDYGIVGQAWTLDHLFEDEVDSILAVMEQRMLSDLKHVPPNRMPCDLVSAGHLVYATHRYPHGHSKEILEVVLGGIGDRLSDGTIGTAVYGDLTGNRLDQPQNLKTIRTGIAHGNAGLMLALAKCAALTQNTQAQEIAQILAKAIHHIGYRQNYATVYAKVHLEKGETNPIDPVAIRWCIGQLCLSYAQIGYGWWLDDPESIERGKERTSRLIKHFNHTDRDLELAKITSARVCHGTIGNALLMTRLNSICPEPEYEELILFFLQTAIEKHWSMEGIEGFPVEIGLESKLTCAPGFWGSESCLMALLSFTTGDEPIWDSCLALS